MSRDGHEATAGLGAVQDETSVRGFIEAAACARPSAPALLATDGSVLTYRDVLRRVDGLATALRRRGVRRSDRVALVLPDGIDAVIGFLATASVAVACPLNPAYRQSELEWAYADFPARALVVSDRTPEAARAAAAVLDVPIIDPANGIDGVQRPSASGEGEGTRAKPDDVALVLHTSGTTSRPKLVPLTHANLCVSATNVASWLGLSADDRCLGVMPLFHIHGLVAALLATIAARASLVCTPGLDSSRVFGWLRDLGATWYTAVPTIHQAIVARAAHEERPAPLRFVRSSSAPLPRNVAVGLAELFDCPVLEAYGMTEAAHQMCCNPLTTGTQRFGSVGVPAGPEVGVMDSAGNILARGETGEVVVRGANVMRGYRDPAANQRAFTGGWFRTGDLGYFDADGYLYLAGRIKEIINRGGEKIAPREIDDVLLEHPAVAQAVTFAIPDERLGEEVGAAVVLKSDATADEAGLISFVSARVAGFKVPRRIAFVADIPKGPTGKLQRNGLAESLGLTGPATSHGNDAARDAAPAMENVLANIWQRVLALPRVVAEDDFFMLGGDSLLAARVIALVREECGRELPITAFFAARTLGAMARVVEQTPQ